MLVKHGTAVHASVNEQDHSGVTGFRARVMQSVCIRNTKGLSVSPTGK